MKAGNYERYVEAMQALRASGVPYKPFSDHHLIVADRFDFWPSTGKWHERKPGAPYHANGIAGLLAVIASNPAPAPTSQETRARTRTRTRPLPSAMPVPSETRAIEREWFAPPEQPAFPAAVQAAVDNAPLHIMYAAHMSEFTIGVYEQAGYVILGKPQK